MEILGIISICAIAVLIVINLVVLFKKNSAINSMSDKDYIELRTYIQTCFDEQNKINEKINMIIVNSMAKNNDSVINTVTKNSGLQLQQLDAIMNRLSKILENNAESMKNATMVLQEFLKVYS